MRATVLMVLVAITVVSPSATAQSLAPPRGHVDITLIAAQAVGDLRRSVDEGFGVELGMRYQLDPGGLLSLRGSVGLINYGHESTRYCSAYGCRVNVDLATDNNILFAGIGPELGKRFGPIRPYLRATVGVGYFVTTSRLSGSDDWSGDSYATTTNYDDVVLQLRSGAGLSLRLSNGRTPVFLDVGTDYHHNGTATYLVEGDIIDQPDGSIVLNPRRSDANLWTFRIGVSLGIPRG